MKNRFMENPTKNFNKDNIELYTPKHLVDAIIPHLKKEQIIWAPFDLESSNFVRYLRKKGFKVIFSHIIKGQDFLTYEPTEKWDIILSNPPFKNKSKWIERASSFNKPFAFVLPVMWINDISWNKYHEKNDFEIIIPNRRISFDGTTKTCAFKSAFFTSGLKIGKTIITKNIEQVEEEIPMYFEIEKLWKDGK